MNRSKPESCIGCACESHGTDFTSVEGTGSSGVLCVAEASGEHEAREGLPLRPFAPAGGVFERTLRRMGIDRAMLSVTNCIRCRPRNNFLENAPWEYSALRHCRPNLDAVIAERRPRAIVALGGIPTRELTGLAGTALGVSHLAGYALPGPNNIPVVPNFHPAFIRRGKASYMGVFARIIQRALNIARGKDRDWLWNVDPSDRSTHGGLRYNTRPTLEEARSFALRVAESSGAVLSFDIETSESLSLDEDAREGFNDTELRLIQFSMESGTGMALPWEGGFRYVARDILKSSNVKCGHNVWLFDNKVLRAVGLREGIDLTPNGVIHDTLQMFHHWQPDLPAHLQFCAQFVSFPFPWKHLAGTDIEFYGCCDVDSTLRLYNMLEATLRRDNLWGDEIVGYLGQVYHVRPVLAGMEDRGFPIDDAARVALGAEFDAAKELLGTELMALFPEECKKLDAYKTFPPELKKLPEAEWGKLFREKDRIDEKGRTHAGKWYRYAKRMVPEAIVGPDKQPAIAQVERWCYIPEFNPNSGDHVIAYMKHKKHKVPKNKHKEDEDGNQPDTTAEKELRRLAERTGDTFYLKVIEYRGLGKLRGTYIYGFAPGPDGFVHTSFTFDTAIGQLSSRNPNTQNFPKLKPTAALAKAMRGMVAAKPGMILTEWDYKSCHALTLGYLARSPRYMRLARLDIHSFVAGHFLNLWDGSKIINESDADLLARFKWLKSDPERKRVRDDQAKHGILGIGNGLKAKGLFERYMEQFPPRACPTCHQTGRVPGVRGTKKCHECKGSGMQPGLRIAEQVLEIAEALFPEVFAWQRSVQKIAHEKMMLRTEFGHIRRFYEVFRWDSRRHDWGHGDQAEQAISYWLSNIAHSHIRETMKEIRRRDLDRKYGLYNQIHDALQFTFPESMLEEHVREVYPVMVAPSKVLCDPLIAPDGLRIDVEASWGARWNDMHEIALPKMRIVDGPCLPVYPVEPVTTA